MFNETTNFSSNTAKETFHIQKVLKWISLAELFWIVVFNLILITLLLIKKRNSRMAFFVRNLAISDLFVGIGYLLPDFVIYYCEVNFVSKVSCYIYLIIRNIPVYASTFSLVVLTLDRLYAVTRPIESATSVKKYKILSMSVSWILAVMFCIPYYVSIKYKDNCYYDIDGTWLKVYFIYDTLVNVVFPLTIMGVCYTIIVVTICRKQRSTVMQVVLPEHDNQQSVQESFLKDRSTFFGKAKIRSIKLLLVVITAYAVCWTPATIGHALIMCDVIEWGTVYRLLHVLAPLNSLVNPLVFLLFNLDLLKFKLPYKHNPLSVTRSTSYRMYTSGSNEQRKCNMWDKKKPQK